MSDQSANTGEQVTPQTGASAGQDASGMIPKARFDEVNVRMKAAEATLQKLQKDAENRERADLEAKGQYDTLKSQYETELTQLRDKAGQWDSYQTIRRETLLAGLQDADKPLADGLPLDKLEALVSRLNQAPAQGPLAGQQQAPKPAAVPGAAQVGQKLTPAEISEGVKKFGTQFLRDNFSRM